MSQTIERARGFQKLLIGALIASLAPLVQASCRLNVATFVPQDVQMDMAQVMILPSVPVGGLIKELVVSINQRDRIAQCTNGGTANGRFTHAAQQTLVQGFSNVYATDVAGVGIRVYRDAGTIQTYYPHTLVPATSSGISLAGGTFRVELIKTAAATGSGSIAPAGRFTTYYLDGDGPDQPILVSTFKGSGTTVVSPTCAVQAGSRNIVVNFGALPANSFAGVGSRTINRDFDIRLDCQGSNVSQFQSRISVRLDAVQDPSNLPGVLPLTATTDAATGIGIELVRRGGSAEKELRFAENIDLGLSVAGSSSLSLPLRARYIQTRAGKVKPGRADGTVTFTIQYN